MWTIYFDQVLLSLSFIKTNYFVHIIFQSNEVGGAVNCEKEGLTRALKFFEESGLAVAIIVTDRHPQIQKYLREQHPHITHYYDIWHVSKGL